MPVLGLICCLRDFSSGETSKDCCTILNHEMTQRSLEDLIVGIELIQVCDFSLRDK